MTRISELTLQRLDGTPQSMSAYAGKPVVVQTLRYFG
jgi:hypothetical protein